MLTKVRVHGTQLPEGRLDGVENIRATLAKLLGEAEENIQFDQQTPSASRSRPAPTWIELNIITHDTPERRERQAEIVDAIAVVCTQILPKHRDPFGPKDRFVTQTLVTGTSTTF